ncbi:MAG: AAA family ATPase [Anaerolineae bacterium]|nr:AAA family ATPase [Anaerolineae bacterium]
MEYHITDDLDRLREVLPASIRRQLEQIGREDELLEIILDLGRVPTARYTDGEVVLSEVEVTPVMIEYVVDRIGDFDADNRAGLERTLHRISAIRNRRADVVGLTCRVGRAVYGTIDIIRDLIESGQSLLMLGPPGVGKTTMLREAARVLAEKRRVVIVDTSNEIGGDGDVPHPAIGRARRMQVARPELQHEVMIEAVENHNPEVIVIDEIGRELEAQAARTIAERGVQLIGTAHGNTLDNLLLNPTLSDLVGGIESVTLSDEEARRRGTQKTVLERRAPPTFDVLVELQTRNSLHVLEDVAAAVDGALRGRPLPVEARMRRPDGEIMITTERPDYSQVSAVERGGRRARGGEREGGPRGEGGRNGNGGARNGSPGPRMRTVFDPMQGGGGRDLPVLHVFLYGVARNRLQQAAKRINVPLVIEDHVNQAQALVTLKNFYRRRPRLIVDAEREGVPIYVLRANTVTQMENFLIDLFQLERRETDPLAEGMREAENAIELVLSGVAEAELEPQPAYIRKRQHEMARQANLLSNSYGKEPYRHVRISRE